MTQSEIEKYFERCEFDDECDFCNNPQDGSYVEMSGYSPGHSAEAEFFICGKCAPEKIIKLKAEEEYWENISDEELNKLLEIE